MKNILDFAPTDCHFQRHPHHSIQPPGQHSRGAAQRYEYIYHKRRHLNECWWDRTGPTKKIIGTLTGRTKPIEETEAWIPICKKVWKLFKESSKVAIILRERVSIYHIETTWVEELGSIDEVLPPPFQDSDAVPFIPSVVAHKIQYIRMRFNYHMLDR